MTSKTIQFLQATPVLKISDYPRARAYYVEKLGFRVTEEGGDPPRFGIIQRESCILYLDSWHGAGTHVEGVWDAYIHVANLQGLLKEFEASGVTIDRPITKTVYGMNEFDVTDPDGNRLCFGEDINPTVNP